MKINKKVFVLAIIIGFIGSLYLVEIGPFSSRALSEYNNGYGTFDMKSYDEDVVFSTLNKMQDKGFDISNKYYLGDFIFIVFLFGIQIIITKNIFSWLSIGKIKNIILSLPVLRGIFDVIENILLLIIINSYPERYSRLVMVSSIFTNLKLLFIKIWCLVILSGLIIKLYKSKRLIPIIEK